MNCPVCGDPLYDGSVTSHLKQKHEYTITDVMDTLFEILDRREEFEQHEPREDEYFPIDGECPVEIKDRNSPVWKRPKKCGARLYKTKGGIVCENGHGGVI